jgi:hypothetical protein
MKSNDKAAYSIVAEGKIVFSGTFMQCWMRVQFMMLFSSYESIGIVRKDSMNGHTEGTS